MFFTNKGTLLAPPGIGLSDGDVMHVDYVFYSLLIFIIVLKAESKMFSQPI